MAALLSHQLPQPVSPAHAELVTYANSFQSPLLRLPGEIRKRIYAFVFTVKCVSWVDNRWSRSDLVDQIPSRTPNRRIKYPLSQLISSTMVCRQFYAEASPLIPRLNELCFTGLAFVRKFGQNFTENMPHKFVQGIETVWLVNCVPGTLERTKTIADITLQRMCGLKKIVVRHGPFHSNPGPSIHEREVREKMFVEVLRKEGIECEVVFDYPVRR
ncbi:hypothetical protein B0T12DRAFT_396820 [Alternaria alternata]|nr:hypothetical protein B0T12DRAFT_396820 [Alternaria alternata]